MRDGFFLVFFFLGFLVARHDMVWWRVLRFLHVCRSVKGKNGIVGNDSKWAFLLYYTKVSLLDNP